MTFDNVGLWCSIHGAALPSYTALALNRDDEPAFAKRVSLPFNKLFTPEAISGYLGVKWSGGSSFPLTRAGLNSRCPNALRHK